MCRHTGGYGILDEGKVNVLKFRTPGSGERSGSVVECLTQEREVVGSNLTGVTSLWSLSKTHLS